MGQWVSSFNPNSSTADLSTPKRQVLDDSSMRTPQSENGKVLPIDPRSPTFEYDRTPIQVDGTPKQQSATTENDENSPKSSMAAARPRSLHQRMMDKKLSAQDS